MNLTGSSFYFSTLSLNHTLRVIGKACFGLTRAQINGEDLIFRVKFFRGDSGFLAIGRARCVAFDHPIVEVLVFIKIPSRWPAMTKVVK